MAHSYVHFVDPRDASVHSRFGLETYDDFLHRAESKEAVSDSRSTRTVRLILDDGPARLDCHLKIFKYENRARRMRWRPDKAAIESRNYQLIRDNSPFGVPRVIARGIRSAGLRHLDGFILTETIPSAITLEELARDSNARHSPAFAKMLKALAEGLATMHNAGIVHIDLQTRNVLISGETAIGFSIHLIDATRGGRRTGPVAQCHGALRDLSALYKDARHWMTHRQLLQWLKSYRGIARLSEVDRNIIQVILRDRTIKDGPAHP